MNGPTSSNVGSWCKIASPLLASLILSVIPFRITCIQAQEHSCLSPKIENTTYLPGQLLLLVSIEEQYYALIDSLTIAATRNSNHTGIAEFDSVGTAHNLISIIMNPFYYYTDKDGFGHFQYKNARGPFPVILLFSEEADIDRIAQYYCAFPYVVMALQNGIPDIVTNVGLAGWGSLKRRP